MTRDKVCFVCDGGGKVLEPSTDLMWTCPVCDGEGWIRGDKTPDEKTGS